MTMESVGQTGGACGWKEFGLHPCWGPAKCIWLRRSQLNRKYLHLLIYKELNEKDEFRMLAIFKNEKGELSIFGGYICNGFTFEINKSFP